MEERSCKLRPSTVLPPAGLPPGREPASNKSTKHLVPKGMPPGTASASNKSTKHLVPKGMPPGADSGRSSASSDNTPSNRVSANAPAAAKGSAAKRKLTLRPGAKAPIPDGMPGSFAASRQFADDDEDDFEAALGDAMAGLDRVREIMDRRNPAIWGDMGMREGQHAELPDGMPPSLMAAKAKGEAADEEDPGFGLDDDMSLAHVRSRRKGGAAAAQAADADDEPGGNAEEMAGLEGVREARRKKGAAAAQAADDDDDDDAPGADEMAGLEGVREARRKRGAAAAQAADDDEEDLRAEEEMAGLDGVRQARRKAGGASGQEADEDDAEVGGGDEGMGLERVQARRKTKAAARLAADEDDAPLSLNTPRSVERGRVENEQMGLHRVQARRKTKAAALQAADMDDELGLALDEAMAGLEHLRQLQRQQSEVAGEDEDENGELRLSLLKAMSGLEHLMQARQHEARGSAPDANEEEDFASLGRAMEGLDRVRKVHHDARRASAKARASPARAFPCSSLPAIDQPALLPRPGGPRHRRRGFVQRIDQRVADKSGKLRTDDARALSQEDGLLARRGQRSGCRARAVLRTVRCQVQGPWRLRACGAL